MTVIFKSFQIFLLLNFYSFEFHCRRFLLFYLIGPLSRDLSIARLFIGLSALAVEAYGFTLIHSSVRARRDIWRSAHQIFLKLGTKLHLGETKKCSKRIFEKNSRFRDFGQKWPIFAIFSQKIRFSDIFFETAHQICLKLGQKLGTIALYHLKAVLCPGKFLFWPFWPFLGQNTLW